MSKQIKIWMIKSIEYGTELIIDYDPSRMSDYIVLGEGFAEITPTDTDPHLTEAEALERKKSDMMADHELAIEKIDERIQSLLAISHSGSEQ